MRNGDPVAHLPLALRPADAARALGVCPRTLWGWTRDGVIPVVKLGRVTMYRVDDLRAFLAANASKGGAA